MDDKNVTDSPAQIEDDPELVAMDIVGVTLGVTVIVIPELVAELGFAQLALEIRPHVITGFPERVLVVKVALVSFETGLPSIYHWYSGLLPPLTGVAVNVTDVF